MIFCSHCSPGGLMEVKPFMLSEHCAGPHLKNSLSHDTSSVSNQSYGNLGCNLAMSTHLLILHAVTDTYLFKWKLNSWYLLPVFLTTVWEEGNKACEEWFEIFWKVTDTFLRKFLVLNLRKKLCVVVDGRMSVYLFIVCFYYYFFNLVCSLSSFYTLLLYICHLLYFRASNYIDTIYYLISCYICCFNTTNWCIPCERRWEKAVVFWNLVQQKQEEEDVTVFDEFCVLMMVNTSLIVVWFCLLQVAIG